MSHNDNQNDQEAYHYPEEEYVVPSSKNSAASEAAAAAQDAAAASVEHDPVPAWRTCVTRNQRVLLAASVGVIAMIGFHFMHAAPTAAAQKPVVKAGGVSQSAALQAENQRLQQSMQQLRLRNQSSTAQVTELQHTLAALRQQMAQVRQAHNQTKQALVLLLEQVKSLNAQLQQRQALSPAKVQGPKLVYSLRAVVSGRAWVVGSNGLSQTVSVGDPIPGYGVVESIDPERGVVTTSTGRNIKYGLNDF